MKTDLVSSIGLAVFGVIVSFVVCNLFFGEIESVSFTAIDSSVETELEEPSVEIFNYKALNPTVEVFVGNCTDYSESGECINQSTSGENLSETDQNLTGNQ